MLLPGLLLVAASGCRRGGEDNPPQPASGTPVQVEVINHFALPVEIYAVGAGVEYRLGIVHPHMEGHFAIPPAMIGGGSLEFHAQPTPPTRGIYKSGPLLIAPGRIVDLVIAAQLFNSTATLRP
jgi:hypothetical protein